MKNVTVGIFTDTHANLHALRAVLEYFRSIKCDHICHLGDCVCMGAFPAECMQILLRSDIISVRGNHDNDYLLNSTAKKGNSHVIPEHKERTFFLAGDSFKKDIEALPYIRYATWFGRTFCFTHYARYYDELMGREKFYTIEEHASPARLDEMFSYVRAEAVFYGHKHSPSLDWGKRLYMDVGSLACHRGAYARGAVLRVYENSAYSIERISVPYDRNSALSSMAERDIPGMDEMEKYYYAGD